jgi:uncharacterized membrane protein YccC
MAASVAKQPRTVGVVIEWLQRHDPNYMALRRASRTAIVASALFAFSFEIIGNLEIATYAAFGSIALLMLVDFSGSLRVRLQAELWLSVTGAFLVCLGTLTSQTLWLSVVLMALVAMVVLFLGIVSSVIASASTSLLLVFILSSAVAGAPSTIPDRLAGWGLATVAALFALWLLWPSHKRDPLRLAAATACRALALRLRDDVAHWRDDASIDDETYEAAIEDADHATELLHRGFLSTQWRPSGLSVPSRATVRLVDEILWLDTLVDQSGQPEQRAPSHQHDCQIRASSAAILEVGAQVLDGRATSPSDLRDANANLAAALAELAESAISMAPSDQASSALTNAPNVARNDEITQFINSLEPSFRAQEIGFVASLIGANVDLISSAERRSWLDTLVGQVPGDVSSRLGAARDRAAAHLNRHSVWLHNSLRGAIGLALAVLIAEEAGVQHAFWVILGALSVLRSSAVNTGANALRALLGTAIGFVLGAVLLAVIGTNYTVLWYLLPVSILIAGFAPTAISFTAGQVGFTLTLVILWNILQPIGWRVGLYRVEDIAIGCAVSVGVGLFFWPRGAAAALGATLRDAYETSAAFLVAAIAHSSRESPPEHASPISPEPERASAAAAARRLDDAFRTYIGERGSKPLALADVATLVRGVASLRQTAEAVLDLWGKDVSPGDDDRSLAHRELVEEARHLERWYDEFGAALSGEGAVPDAAVRSPTFDQSIISAIDDDLRVHDANQASAVRFIWTKDYLGVSRQLEETLVPHARSAVQRGTNDSSALPGAG